MWGQIVSKKVTFDQFVLEKCSTQSISAVLNIQSINEGKLTLIVHNRAINVICVHQFHIWEVVCYLLADDILVHVLVVEVVHQEQ